jgi:hypothetical protein
MDGTLAYLGRIEVGRHPSALAVRGTTLYVTLAGSDRVAAVDTKLRKVARYLALVKIQLLVMESQTKCEVFSGLLREMVLQVEQRAGPKRLAFSIGR